MNHPAEFSVTVTGSREPEAPSALRVAISGDLDYAHVAELETVFDHRFPDLSAGARAIVDLSEVTYCDSCGLRVLLGAAHRLAERGGELVLRGVSGQPARALRLTGLDSVLPDEDPAPF